MSIIQPACDMWATPEDVRSLRKDEAMRTRLEAWVVLLAVGCAPMAARLEGAAGPVAWRVTDLQVVEHEIEGHAYDVYAVKLVLQELRGSGITFTRYEQSVSDFSLERGVPRVATGRWTLPANGEWSLTLGHALVCPPVPGGCVLPLETSAPEFHVLLNGTNAAGEVVEVSIRVRLPPTQLRICNP
jgi:hypothetical protein